MLSCMKHRLKGKGQLPAIALQTQSRILRFDSGSAFAYFGQFVLPAAPVCGDWNTFQLSRVSMFKMDSSDGCIRFGNVEKRSINKGFSTCAPIQEYARRPENQLVHMHRGSFHPDRRHRKSALSSGLLSFPLAHVAFPCFRSRARPKNQLVSHRDAKCS